MPTPAVPRRAGCVAWPSPERAGCASNTDVIRHAVDAARAACEARGGRFELKNPPRMESGELLDHDVSVDADCLTPGEDTPVVQRAAGPRSP